MKRILYQMVLTVMLTTVGLLAQAQELEEIISKHIEAHGGAEKWDAIESMKITGRFTAFSVEQDWYAYKTKNGGYYSQLELGKYHVEEAFDGKKGWTIDPWQEITFPRELNSAEQNVFYQKAEFFTPFYHYKERGINVELVGKDDLDGVEVFVLKVTRPNRRTETWYLDTQTYLEVKSESNWVDFAYRTPAESYFDDFREVDGLVIPFFIERTFLQRNRILQIQKVQFNLPVDTSWFTIPRSVEMNNLAFLEGNWNVNVEMWYARANRWYLIDRTTSNIVFQSTNLLKEEIRYNNVFVRNKLIHYSYYSPDDNYRITVYDAFNSNIEVYSGELNDSSFVFDNLSAHPTDTLGTIPLSKYEWKRITSDSLVLSIQESYDAAKNWSPVEKLTYVRKKE